MKIEYTTHSALWIYDENLSLVTDPFFFLDRLSAMFMDHFPPHEFGADHFGDIDFLFCSHDHDDHSHYETLVELKPYIKQIILPENKQILSDRIKRAGLNNILYLKDEKPTQLTPDLTVTCYPDLNGIDTTLLITYKGKTIMHQNDCPLDMAAFERIAKNHTIDYAFIPHTSCQDLYPLFLPRDDETLERLAKEKENLSCERIIRSLKILKPKMMIPYGYTQVYTNPDQLKLNGFNRITPPLFKKYCDTHYPQGDCRVMQPGDVINTEDNSIIPIREKNLWGDTLEEYLKNIEDYTKSHPERYTELDYGYPQEAIQNFENFMSDRFQKPFPKEFANQTLVFHIQGNQGETLDLYLDTENKTLTKTTEKLPFVEITLPAIVLNELIRQQFNIFSILFCYRVKCELNLIMGMDDQSECVFYTMIIIALFDPEMHAQLWQDIVKKTEVLKNEN